MGSNLCILPQAIKVSSNDAKIRVTLQSAAEEDKSKSSTDDNMACLIPVTIKIYSLQQINCILCGLLENFYAYISTNIYIDR